ncbi:MAG TPA: TauD/TfdA family dioxygenase [Streptosporangiaceae bacterium]|jgi:gamma-butyrobetaine dioxygenase|nr:TauD/TfdA family dioxygenase [Streptosporangiaceae bacterium]
MDVGAWPAIWLRSWAGTFGYVRETNYGRVFDVRVESTPANLASTRLALSPHTDNPYRDPVPTVQLLHCHLSAAGGGDTLLVDGFAAAAQLRGEDPGSFAVLTRTPVPFGYRDRGTELRACQPLIELSADGRIRGIRFNNRSLQALRRPPGEVAAFYVAYRRWGAAAGPARAGPDAAADPGRLPYLRAGQRAGRAGRTKEMEKEKEEVKAGASGGRDR